MYKDGFKPDYCVWTEQGEVLLPENQFGAGYVGSSSTGVHVGSKKSRMMTWKKNLSRYQGMNFDTAGHEFGCILNLRKRFPIWMIRDFIVC